MEDKPRGTFTSDWQARAAVDQLSDTPPDGIPVVREQLWRPAHLPAETYWEPPPAPMGRWARVLAMARPYARVFILAAVYLAAVAAVSLIVTRVLSTPAKSTSAAGTGHQQTQNSPVPHRLAPHKLSAPRKPPAIQPGSSIFPPQPGLALFTPSPASSQPSSSPPSLSPSPAPTPAPPPTSPPPTSPPPTSPPPTSPTGVPTPTPS